MTLATVKYIALLAMVKIVPSHPHLVVDYQDEILQSVDDADVSIRMRALELTSAMVSMWLDKGLFSGLCQLAVVVPLLRSIHIMFERL